MPLLLPKAGVFRAAQALVVARGSPPGSVAPPSGTFCGDGFCSEAGETSQA
jgi:hypothetical protein